MSERYDYQQQLDDEAREQEALQALIEIAAAGLTRQAETLAYHCGLGQAWKQQFQPTRNQWQTSTR